MKNITILALDGTIASTVTGPTDIFSLAGVLWNQISGVQPEPYFKVFIASVQGKPVECLNGIVIQPHLSLDEVKRTDLVIISAEDFPHFDYNKFDGPIKSHEGRRSRAGGSPELLDVTGFPLPAKHMQGQASRE